MTPDSTNRSEDLVKLMYGKDVVDHAYASPAGKLTKAQAIDAISHLLEEAEARGYLGAMKYIERCAEDNKELGGHKWSSGDYKKFIKYEIEHAQLTSGDK